MVQKSGIQQQQDRTLLRSLTPSITLLTSNYSLLFFPHRIYFLLSRIFHTHNSILFRYGTKGKEKNSPERVEQRQNDRKAGNEITIGNVGAKKGIFSLSPTSTDSYSFYVHLHSIYLSMDTFYSAILYNILHQISLVVSRWLLQLRLKERRTVSKSENQICSDHFLSSL